MPIATAAVNLHCEGRIALPTLISAWRACENARSAGFDVELLAMLDTADDATAALAEEFSTRGMRLERTRVGDLGAARNEVVKRSDARYIAFLDGDDLWSPNWLTEALRSAEHSDGRATAFHPELNIIFGEHRSALHHMDSEAAAFSWARARLHNPWTALSMAARDVYESMPYPRNDLRQGFGFEDWSWNLELLQRGGRHQTVRDTCHFIRRGRDGSLLSSSQHALRTPFPRSSATHVPEAQMRGATIAVSEPDAEDPRVPATHRHAQLQTSDELFRQIRITSTIEPEIRKTVPSSSAYLPQNFNAHVTAEQRALEELDLAVGSSGAPSLSSALASASLFQDLSPRSQALIVTEGIRLCQRLGRQIGTDDELLKAKEYFPQIEMLA